MEKSIETIWKEGFLKSDALAVPRINNLYNQKSKNIMDHLMSIGNKNITGIVIGASIILLMSIIFNTIPAGIFLFLILIWLAFYTKRLRTRMQEIDQGMNTYDYIKAVDRWLNEVISNFTKIYRIVYPAILVAFNLGLWFSNIGQSMIKPKLSDSYMIWGIPGFWLLGTIVMACLISLLAGLLYRFDLYLVYGRVLEKLEDLLSDMEELRK